jgi:predicted RNase H-like nuclease
LGSCGRTLNGTREKDESGVAERLDLLQSEFPHMERNLHNRPFGVGKDDLLDAAVAAWTAQRLSMGDAHQVCKPERDANGLDTTIWY